MTDYTPTTDEVRGSYVGNFYMEPPYEARERFDRWLAEHDRQVRQPLAQKLADLTRSINDQLGPEVIRQKAEAWDEGHKTGWEHCQDGNYGNDYWDDDTSNPYRQGADQ